MTEPASRACPLHPQETLSGCGYCRLCVLAAESPDEEREDRVHRMFPSLEDE